MPKKKPKKAKVPETRPPEKPTVFLIRVKALVFPQGGNMFDSNEQVARYVEETLNDSPIFFDNDELEVVVKNDTDPDWNE